MRSFAFNLNNNSRYTVLSDAEFLRLFNKDMQSIISGYKLAYLLFFLTFSLFSFFLISFLFFFFLFFNFTFVSKKIHLVSIILKNKLKI